MASIVITVCDQCVAEGRRDPSSDVEQYVIRTKDLHAPLALCAEHAEPLEVLLGRHGRRRLPSRIDTGRIDAKHKTWAEIIQLRDEWRQRNAAG